LWAVLAPNSFFDLFQLARPRYPSIWSTLGLVLGLYGVLYAYAGMRLDRARPIIAIGLAGKILGPVGWILTIHSGGLPIRTFPLIAFDDIVWWLPFGLFLLEGSELGGRLRQLAPLACALVNFIAAGALLLVLRPGVTAGELGAGAAYVTQNGLVWRLGWGTWIAAAMTLVAFYGWWGSRIDRSRLAVAAFAIATVGIACDITAESLFIGWLPKDFETISRLATVLTGGAANGLYTVAGVMLTIATPALRGRLLVWTWAVWATGFLLSAFSLLGNIPGIAVSTAVLFTLFCPWCVAIWRQLR
jgi:hypothetical protein